MGTAGGAVATEQREERVARAAASGGAWVGAVQVSYSRLLTRLETGTEFTDASIAIEARANGTAVVDAAKRVRNEYGGDCAYVYEERGGHRGPLAAPTVTLVGGRYRVDYLNPMIDVTITESCPSRPARTEPRAVLPVYVPIEGRLPGRRATRVTGSLRVDNRYCTDPRCQETELASWDLHLVPAARDGDDRRGGGGGRGRRFAPGADCTRRVIDGTPADDLLRGSGRAELILALAGADVARGRGGGDCIWGGDGDDRLLGGPGNDLIGGDAGSDTIAAGRGSDRVLARDRERDLVRCGKGADTAIVDRVDSVAGCERVRRR